MLNGTTTDWYLTHIILPTYSSTVSNPKCSNLSSVHSRRFNKSFRAPPSVLANALLIFLICSSWCTIRPCLIIYCQQSTTMTSELFWSSNSSSFILNKYENLYADRQLNPRLCSSVISDFVSSVPFSSSISIVLLCNCLFLFIQISQLNYQQCLIDFPVLILAVFHDWLTEKN